MASVAPGSGVVAPPAHSAAFRQRRFLNWFPLGLAYAFLYMGRYNLNVAKNALGSLMTNEDFGLVFGAGTVIYGLAFIWNGPLTDRIGGKRAMLFSTFGAASMNLAMGLYLRHVIGSGTVNHADLRLWFTVLYGANMYFQSFGAVAIVKVNASWFHLRERGGFSGIFGTMIASGVFFAFTLNAWILTLARKLAGSGSGTLETMWVFLVPAGLLWIMFAFEFWVLKDKPSQAGFSDFDTLDASSGEEDVPASRIFVRVLTHPVIITVALIEFCTGVVRQGVMQWYPIYAKSVLALPASHPMRDGSWGRAWT
ncbi:MAG TPA: MFS transporter, partial [Myxococcaceae bacterium]|nr:MFS transporter [Myxococcaceae bacterium]